MGEVPLSLHVDAELKQRLEAEAHLQKMSAGDLAVRAIGRYLEIHAGERAILKERIAEADKGVFISEEAMLGWMDRLVDDPDAAPPEPDIFTQSGR